MEVIFRLEDHCIETEVEDEYEKLAKSLLKEENKKKEKKLEFLKEFLKNSDFNELRKAGFDGSEEMLVRVRTENGDFVVERVDEG